jgi:uncharacterized protein (UPF0548 family)
MDTAVTHDDELNTALADAELTYPEVGATRESSMPAGGYGHVRRDVAIGHGHVTFQRAVDGLFSWNMHRAAGLSVRSNTANAAPGGVVVLQAGFRRWGLMIPCRVIYTVDQPDRRGFAYGTLPGHPEQGEEAFLVTIADNEQVRFTIRAFSRPASRLARYGGPLTRMVQQHVTDRYVRALRRIAQDQSDL